MNLVSRYINIDFVLLFNKSTESIYIAGTNLQPGKCIKIGSGTAHTILGMIQDDSLLIFKDIDELQRHVMLNTIMNG